MSSAGTKRWWPRIQYWSAKYGADPVLVDAIMQCESDGNPSAVSAVNGNATRDYGLMQLNPKGALDSWKANGHADVNPLDPESNMMVGAWFLGVCIPAWLKSLSLPVTRRNTIVTYNAGAGAVKSGKIPATTLTYAAKVEMRYIAGTFSPDATAVAVEAQPESKEEEPEPLTGGDLESGVSAVTSSGAERVVASGVLLTACYSLYQWWKAQ